MCYGSKGLSLGDYTRFALNVNTDLKYFEYIVPCGIKDKAVASLERELGHKIDTNEVKNKIEKYFLEVFEAEKY